MKQKHMKYKEGNLLRAFREVDAIAHVTNCQGVMGSGVALQIKEKFPEAYEVYLKQYNGLREKGLDMLGQISYTKISLLNEYVFNLSAQREYGKDKRHLNYEALYQCLQRMRFNAQDFGIKNIGIPYLMGCDRAGGDWDIVSAMIDSVFGNSDIKITAFKL